MNDSTLSAKILMRGQEIEKQNIRSKDALHIACAIESQCEYFITADGGLTNKSMNKIKIINPVDLVRKMEDKNDD